MTPIQDHEQRYALTNELHARPFPALGAPCHAVHLAIKQPQNAARRDRAADVAHLIDLLDRYGAAHPQPGASNYFGKIGRHTLKWEQHTEFVTYTVFTEGVFDRPFDPASFEVFPDDWLAAAPGVRMTAAMVRVEEAEDFDTVPATVRPWFEAESIALSSILDGMATVASDFRIDPAGNVRFAVFVKPGISPRRIGRIVQRLCEVETYRAMSMLGLALAREMHDPLFSIGRDLSGAVEGMTSEVAQPDDETLTELLRLSGELEKLQGRSAFRFAATSAYEKIVHERIAILREARFQGRQTLAEFMLRRYDPAMRTVKSAERRLVSLTERAGRASELLRTRVDVARSAQNQKLLESMDKRADLQLRLQSTVEGLSVVAISYYALNLVTYIATPFAKGMGVDKVWLSAGAAPLVILGVWWMVRRIRNKMH